MDQVFVQPDKDFVSRICADSNKQFATHERKNTKSMMFIGNMKFEFPLLCISSTYSIDYKDMKS